MSARPAFAITPKIWTAILTTATNTTFGGSTGATAPTNLVLLKQAGDTNSAGANGSKLKRVRVTQRKTTALSAQIIRLFYFDGTIHINIGEISVPAGPTPSSTVQSYNADPSNPAFWLNLDRDIPANKNVYACTTVTEDVTVEAEAIDY
jgi:cobalamin biosynthesis protein CbiG